MRRLALWGEKCIHLLHLQNLLKRDKKTTEAINILYAREDREAVFWRLWQERTGMFLITLISVLVMILLFFSQTDDEVLQKGHLLSRDREKVTLAVKMDKEGEQTEKEMNFQIEEKRLTDTELSELFAKVEKELMRSLQGKNASLLTVNQNLNFIEKLSGYPVTVSWIADSNYIKGNGSLRYNKIPLEGVDTEVAATVLYRKKEKKYCFPVHLVPKELTPEQAMVQLVRKKIRQTIKKQKYQKKIMLPQEVEGIKVSYKLPKTSYFPQIGLFLLFPFFLPFYWQEQMNKKKKNRTMQLMIDYPELVQKFTLLLGAGLTIRYSIERMVKDYEDKRKKGGDYRYLYEELALVCNEIHNGVSERKAIEHFGKRCRQLSYLRFSTLVTQNMRKGTAGLMNLLEAEAVEALEQRRELVKQLGEQASTKLLLPMGIMLVLVMGIVMVPAFLSL